MGDKSENLYYSLASDSFALPLELIQGDDRINNKSIESVLLVKQMSPPPDASQSAI